MKKELGEFGLAQPEQSEDAPFKKPAFFDSPQNVEKDTTINNNHSHFDDVKKELEEFGLAQPEQSKDPPFKKPAFCDLVEEKKQDDSGEIDFGNEFKLKLSIAKRLETTRPRLYNILLYVVFPLLFMIGLCFLFGYGLAKFESPVEIAGNHDIIRDWFNDTIIINDLVPSVEKSYKDCLVQFQNETLPTDSLVSFMDNCTKDQVNVQNNKAKYLSDKGFVDLLFNDNLSFNWVVCGKNETSGRSLNYFQSGMVLDKWVKSYEGLKDKYHQNGVTPNDAHEIAMAEANGSESCLININGASSFWYTIMTTIGYGNTAPVTTSGRMLVYFLGFLSICLFTSIIANAAFVGLTIADDFFSRVGLRRMTEGIFAVVFWLIMLLIWLIIITCVFVFVNYEILGMELDLWDSERLR